VLDEATSCSFRNAPQIAVIRPVAWRLLRLSNASQSAGISAVSLPDHLVFHSCANSTRGCRKNSPNMSKSTMAWPSVFRWAQVPLQSAELVSVAAILIRPRSAGAA
jgi:hypothetical protein